MTAFRPPTDAHSAERLTRCAPRWAWEIIDIHLRGGAGSSPAGRLVQAVREAMCDGCDEED